MVNVIFISLASLAAAFQLRGLKLTYLILERRRLQRIDLEATNTIIIVHHSVDGTLTFCIFFKETVSLDVLNVNSA